jgi:hypothetical protein
MPRYFFHVEHEELGEVVVELPDDKAARAEAIKVAGEILSEICGAFPGPEWIMHVRDARGNFVLVLRFSVEERPA